MNLQAQPTIRLYDPELIYAIEQTYQAHKNEFKSKNEFMTELLRLGLKAMGLPPNAPAGASFPPPALAELSPMLAKIQELMEETSKVITVQFKQILLYMKIVLNLISSVYNMQLGDLSGLPLLPQKVEDGFFDDLPMRFDKLILDFEKKYGLK